MRAYPCCLQPRHVVALNKQPQLPHCPSGVAAAQDANLLSALRVALLLLPERFTTLVSRIRSVVCC